MKKILAIAMVFALLLPALAGCQSAYAAQHTPEASSQPSGYAISREQALELALADAGLTHGEIYDVEVEQDKDRNSIHYDVDFEKDGRDYEYEIDAQTGAILHKKVPTATPTTPPVTPETTPTVPVTPDEPAKQLTRQEAIDIALSHASLTLEQVRDLDAETDRDWGIVHYEVEFEALGYEYEYEIHAETGEILRVQKERD